MHKPDRAEQEQGYTPEQLATIERQEREEDAEERRRAEQEMEEARW